MKSAPIPAQLRSNAAPISDPVPVSAVTTNPGGIITSQFFGYSGSYTVADTIVPGRSYWIKVSADGEVILQRQ